MNDRFDAIHFHLGVRLDAGSLNHYSLIGLHPSADETMIKRAFKDAAARWNASDTKSNAESAKHVASLLKDAQATLLNADRRKAYDRLLFPNGVAESMAELDEVDVQVDESGELLSPFDPTRAFPVSSVRYFGSPSERWEALASVVALAEPPPNTEIASDDRSVLSVARVPIHEARSPTSANARIELLKRKRKQKQFIVVGLLTLGALGFLGFASFRYLQSQQRLAQAKSTSEKPTVPKQTSPNASTGGQNTNLSRPAQNEPTETNQPKTVRSNLPSLMKEPTEPIVDGEANEKEGMFDMPMQDKPPANPAEMMPETKPDTPKMEMANSPSQTMGNDGWKASMKAARQAIETGDFAEFHKQIEAALPLARTDLQETKRKRLDQLGQLYEIGLKAMTESRTKLRGTETISVGKTKVNIVEVREDVLIVRQGGKNEQFAWNEIPMGIALAISNFTLSETEPTDIAARAIYLALSPKKNDLYDKAIQELFKKCLGKGEILSDLDQALTDVYE